MKHSARGSLFWRWRRGVMRKRMMLAAWAAIALATSAGPTLAQQNIRVGWTIPAEESKYWMMKRPTEFPDLGKTYNIEWTQFQGTAPMTQALPPRPAAPAAHGPPPPCQR